MLVYYDDTETLGNVFKEVHAWFYIQWILRLLGQHAKG